MQACLTGAMHTAFQDLRYAIRTLTQERLFTLMAVTTLALGIGANSAIFAVVNTVLLRPLPYRDAGQIVLVEDVIPQLTREGMVATPQDFLEFQRNSKAFSSVAAYTFNSVDLTGLGEPERLQSVRASAALFDVLGTQPVLGRGFTPAEDHPASGVAVISYSLWQGRFGGDPGVVGRVVNLDRQPTRILGVMPKDFEFPMPGMLLGGKHDVWMPMGFTPFELATPGLYNYGMIARLKPGVSLAQAQADAHAVAHGIWEKYLPQVRAEFTLDAQVTPVKQQVVAGSRRLIWLLAGAVGFVLLIGCVNLANLLLGRAARRETEFAVRSSLGASRTRLLRQLLTESVLLGAAGGTAGLLLALWLVGLLARAIPATVPRAGAINLDWRVVTFTAALSILAGLLFGAIPALAGMRSNEAGLLRGATRGSTAGRGHTRLRGLLVVSEIALSMVLLVGAGLLVRSLVALHAVNPGFDIEHVLTARVSLPRSGYPDAAAIREFYQRAVERLSALPGSETAGAATADLLNTERGRLFVVKDPAVPASVSRHAEVLGDYFRAVGIPLRRGRLFDSRDRPGTEPVLVINETLARRYFPGQDPIGKQIKLGSRESVDPWYTIIGVVGDAKNGGLAQAVQPQTYEDNSQLNDLAIRTRTTSMVLAVKASGSPEALAAGVRAVIARIDPELPVSALRTTQRTVEQSLGPQRFQTGLVGTFALLAMLLAAVGIYGVVSYAVTQRTREIGVRMALGASRQGVIGMVVGQGMQFVVAGIVLGVAASVGLSRFMNGFVYGIKTTDTLTFVLAALVLSLVALLANLAPARRAASVDPIAALKYE